MPPCRLAAGAFARSWLLVPGLAFLMTAAASAQLIIAHRGASHDAPENTLAAFRLAWEQEADGIEGDFHLTRDGRIICIHDADAKRVAKVDRKVADMNFDEVRQLDVGRWKHERFAGEKAPTLEEVLGTVPAGKLFFIEIKCGPQIVEPMVKVLAASKVRREQLRIISFNADVIAASKRALPQVQAYWLTGYKQDKHSGAWSPGLPVILDTLEKIEADGLDTQAHDLIDAGFVARLREAKMAFHCWTVDDVAVAKRFRKLGVESITTNRPAWLREQLKN